MLSWQKCRPLPWNHRDKQEGLQDTSRRSLVRLGGEPVPLPRSLQTWGPAQCKANAWGLLEQSGTSSSGPGAHGGGGGPKTRRPLPG